MTLDPLTIGMLVVLAVLVFFMFRNSRKRQRDAQELQSKVAVGAEVMTNFGVYGTILAIDEEENKVLVETSPGTVLTVHRQTVTRVVTPSPLAEIETSPDHIDESEPAYGERIDDAADTTTDAPAADTSAADKTDKKGDE